MTAPTTRETADHAELLVLLRAMCETAGGPHAEWDRIDACAAALLSEIAALRGEHKLTLQDGSEAWCSDAAWRWFQEWAVRLEQAERQRDEAVGLLRLVDTQARVGHGGKPVMRSSRINLPATLWHQVRAFLANQGADQ